MSGPALRRVATRLVSAAAFSLALSGCAYSMISDGAVRPESLRMVIANTVSARGIEPSEPIAVQIVDRDRLREILTEVFTERRSLAELEDYQRALTAIGLWPADRNLIDEVLAVYSQEVVGLYVPSHRGLYLIEEPPRQPVSVRIASALVRRDLFSEFALTHEIVHLLQHQEYPGLMEPDGIPLGHDDLETSIQAAIEGDAMRYGFEAMGVPLPSPSSLREDMENEQTRRQSSALADAPALIRMALDFPYSRGYALSYSEGSRLLDRPPISSEQVLHVERRYEPFLLFDLAGLAQRLPPECRILEENGVGELALSILFRDLSSDPNPAIWDGWNGDRYLVADCAGRDELIWWTAWDSEQDAREFAEAYPRIATAVAQRASLHAAPSLRRGGAFVVVTSAGLSDLASSTPPPTTEVGDLATLQAVLLENAVSPAGNPARDP